MENNLGYSIATRMIANSEGNSFWEARIKELPDVIEFADTLEEVYALALDTIEATHSLYNEMGKAMPAPFQHASEDFSGRVTLRMPRTLHRCISEIAVDEAVSVNQYMVSALANIIGMRFGHRSAIEGWIPLVSTSKVVSKQGRLINSGLVDKKSNCWEPLEAVVV